MSSEKSSYRQIIKATSIFGGVQLVNIIVQLIRSKVIAILLGPAGFGVLGLLTTTISLVTSATNFGLGTSAVRNISEASTLGDKNKVGETISIVRNLVWVTGLLGMLITIIFSPLLSKITFGDYSYTWSFIIVSISILFGQIAAGQKVLLQGLRKISFLAKSNIYASIFGLLATLPIYFIWEIAGIVPSIILTSIILLLIQFFYSRKIQVDKVVVPLKKSLIEGKSMLKFGFILSISSIIPIFTSYLIRIFISNSGGIEQVGLYSAGFSIISTYVGLVFSAMGTDYYPRLSSIHQNIEKTNELVKQQSEIALLILSPMISFFLIFIDWVVIFMYSKKFLPITDMLHWAILGIYFKALSWSIGYLILAKGDSKAFFINELVANVYLLILNVIGYKYWGLTGLGVSFLIGYLVHFIQMYVFAYKNYKLNLKIDLFKKTFICAIFGILCFIVTIFGNSWKYLTVGTLLIIFSILFSFINLNQKLQLFNFNKLKKFNNK